MSIQDFSLSDWIAAAGICISLATLLLTWRILTRKAMSYESYSHPLLNKSVRRDNMQLSLSANGVVVDDPYLAEVSILNHGNVAIEPKDFYEPIVISFSDAVSIISIDIQAAQPGISVDYTANGAKLTLTPFLINPGDYLLVRAIASNKPNITLVGRISGISHISRQHPYNRLSQLALYGFMVCTLIAIGLWLAERLGFSGSANLAGATLILGFFLLSVAFQSRLIVLYPARKTNTASK